ncbi:class III cytochrome C family protein [Sorangium sp. So ce861]|uniref:class III cytochrome C family protein n=1 Tax=Sorangium sp. So ce861 TaxID=3133323 RepID=UPI003F63D407
MQALLVVAVLAAVALAWNRYAPPGAGPAALGRLVSPGPLSAKHAYLADRCTACHQPTVGVQAPRCVPCHAADTALLSRQSTAFHADVPECTPCHLEHGTGALRPERMDHVALARIGWTALAKRAPSDQDSAAVLDSFQRVLGATRAEDVDALEARAGLACASCHDRRDPHLARFGSDCAQCHATDRWSIAGYMHPAPTSRDCVQCHKPPPSHTMEHFSMISQRIARKEHASVDQCYECHLTTSWNDIPGVGFYKHH